MRMKAGLLALLQWRLVGVNLGNKHHLFHSSITLGGCLTSNNCTFHMHCLPPWHSKSLVQLVREPGEGDKSADSRVHGQPPSLQQHQQQQKVASHMVCRS